VSLLDKKVIHIGTVCELTGLTSRQIRYYEKRKLIHPERTGGGTRRYSFRDIEKLLEISEKMEEGWLTKEIRETERKNRPKNGCGFTLQEHQLGRAVRMVAVNKEC